MIYRLNALGVLNGHPVSLVDVGMRGGIQGYWHVFGKNLRVIGFEPDATEFDVLKGNTAAYEEIVLPYVLDSEERSREFFIRTHNRAADGFYEGLKWWSARMGHTSPEQLPQDYKANLPTLETREGNANTLRVQTTTFNKVARDHKLGQIDFMKLDTEGAELDILKGASDYLKPGGLLGMEVEVRTLPTLDSPLFHEVYAYLYNLGYNLVDVDLYRRSRAVLPLPVAQDHRDHDGNVLAVGHTIGGQIEAGDALFMRDLPTDGFWPDKGNDEHIYRIIKNACLYELFSMPDCAAEMLAYYREPLNAVIDADSLLNYLVPDYFAKPMLYKHYLERYRADAGRLGPSKTFPKPQRQPLWRRVMARTRQRLYSGFLTDLRDGLKLWRVWGHLGFRAIALEHSGSRLGTLWTMLGVAVLIGAQGFLFSLLLGADIRSFYPWFASGLMLWIFLSAIMSSSVGLFRDNRGQMLNINLPYSFYVYKNVTSHLTRFFYYLPIYLVVSLFSYGTIYPTAILGLYGVLVLAVTAVPVGMLLGIIATRFRVIEYIVPTIMPAIFLFTPVMWTVEHLGDHTWIAKYNPLYHYIALVRDPLMGKWIPAESALVTLVVTALCFAGAALAYRIWRKTMIFWA